MPTVGFDSLVLKKDASALASFFSPPTDSKPIITETVEHKSTESQQTEVASVPSGEPRALKALLGLSVATSTPNFSEKYKNTVQKILSEKQIPQRKIMYKGAQLLKQAGEKTEEIITDILNEMEPFIDHIDIYNAFYEKPFISMFGKAQGQRVDPITFVEKSENSFAHICAWWYWKTYNKSEVVHNYQIDHFQGRVTPAWRELENSRSKLSVYFNGSECNALISLSDLLLKLIEIFHFGQIDYKSVARPLQMRCRSRKLSLKIQSHDLARFDWIIKNSVPDTPLDINLNKYLKHPIYFVAWSPTQPRNMVKPSFEWSVLYDNVVRKAIENDGCQKFLDFDKDMTFWTENDYLIPISDADEKHILSLNEMGFVGMPKTLKLSSTSLNNLTT
jgi:hypothetical protein